MEMWEYPRPCLIALHYLRQSESASAM
jgi:hypothetical protein